MITDNKQMAPFTPQRSLMASDPAAVAAGEAVKARIQAAYSMAIYSPRNLDQARAKILRMCEIPEFAEKVEYSKPIGNTKIKGLSIRFAEIALSLCQNILTEAQLLYEDDDIKRIRISALDLETNTQFSRDVSIKKTVERKSKKGREEDYLSERKNSQDQTVYLLRATEDEVLTKESAWVSKFIRTEGLRLIPADIKEEATKKAREVLAKRDREDPNAAKKRILDSFSRLNIWPADIEKYLGHKSDNISPAEIADLRTVYSAIESGEATWAEYVNKDKDPAPQSGLKKPFGVPETDLTGSEAGLEPGTETPQDQPEKPTTPPEFAAIVKQQTGQDYAYVVSKDGIAHDLLSAFVEISADRNQTTAFDIMESVADPGIFPGFWNGFESGTWKQHCTVKLLFDGEKKAESGNGGAPPPAETKQPETKAPAPQPPPAGPPPAAQGANGVKKYFDAVDWKASGLKKKGLEGYWNSYKAFWNQASKETKEAFKKKWTKVFTEDNVLTKIFPGDDVPAPPAAQPEAKSVSESVSAPAAAPPVPADAHASPSASAPAPSKTYRELLMEIHDTDAEGLIQACNNVGYGANLVIPMGNIACQKLYDEYLNVKKAENIG